MSITMQPQSLLGLNCFQIGITNILAYKNYPYSNYVWKQCGLRYDINSNDKVGEIVATYITEEEELDWIHNVKLSYECVYDSQNYIENIIKFIKKNEPILIFTDPYYLQYHSKYQKKHSVHSITLIDFDSDSFVFVDHIQNVKGNISFKAILESTASIYKSENDKKFRVYMILDIKNAKEHLEEIDFVNVIVSNNNALYSGLSSIEKFINDYDNLFDYIDNYKSFFDGIYKDLVSVANKHYQYGNFLKQYEGDIKEIRELSECLINSGQEWKISANLIMKGIYKNPSEMYRRMINKIKGVYYIEKDIIEFSNKICEKILLKK